MARSLEEIKSVLAKNKERLAQMYGIKQIGVFGSFVRGEQKRRSDIDVLVEFEEVPGLIRFIQIEDHLKRLVGRKVDLVRKEAIRPELKERILAEVIYL